MPPNAAPILRSPIRPLRPFVFRPTYCRTFHRAHIYRQQDSDSGARDVQVRRVFFTWRRALRYAVFCFVSYKTLQWGLNRLFEGIELDDEDQTSSAKDGAEPKGSTVPEDGTIIHTDEDDDDVFFIPLQYPQKLPRSYYRNSDPEWQEFKRLSYDDNRQQAIRVELADHINKSVTRQRLMQRKLGQDIKWSRFWLDFTFPDSPPPEYARKGLTIADDYVAWSSQIIPHSQFVKIQHIVWPKAIYTAASDSLKLLYRLQVVKAKTAFGLELSPRDKHAQQILVVFLMQEAQAKKAAEAAEKQQQRQLRQGDAEKLGPSSASEKRDYHKDLEELKKSADNPGFGGMVLNITFPKPPIPADLRLTSRVFMGSMLQQWNHSRQDFTPPGCCYLWGSVELTGTRARCKLEVFAAYDPKNSKFVYVSSKPKHFWDVTQSAKGGP